MENEETQLKRELRLIEARRSSIEICRMVQNSLTGMKAVCAAAVIWQVLCMVIIDKYNILCPKWFIAEVWDKF